MTHAGEIEERPESGEPSAAAPPQRAPHGAPRRGLEGRRRSFDPCPGAALVPVFSNGCVAQGFRAATGTSVEPCPHAYDRSAFDDMSPNSLPFGVIARSAWLRASTLI